jgi:preprotein translocase subunit SecG
MDMKMEKSRNMRVSVGIASILFLIVSLFAGVMNVSAATTELITVDSLEINGVFESGNEDIGVIAGEDLTITLVFKSLEDASDVRIKASLEGEKIDVEKEIFVGDLEVGKRYSRTLALEVPYELKDQVSDDLSLFVQIWNGDYKTELPEVVLRVQRQAYNADIMSIDAKRAVQAGEIFPVMVVVKNIGYNDLDDLYVTAKIGSLDVEKTGYFGDLVSVEANDDEDTTSGILYLQVPYDTKAGEYTLEVKVENEDVEEDASMQIVVTNDFANSVIVTDYRETVAVGEEAEYEIIIANPTNALKVYRIVTESTSSIESSASSEVITVSAGTSKTVKVFAKADSEGEHDFKVDVISGEKIVGSATLTLNAEGSSITNPVVVLTIILAIIFLVLLGVLIVLITKKPKKVEEYGESYY